MWKKKSVKWKQVTAYVTECLDNFMSFSFNFFKHAPGIPKVLVGNRLHLAFKRQVDQAEAENYAEKNNMGFFEVSPLVNFNISETFVELARMALKRNGMERLWRSNKGKDFCN